MTLIDAHPAVPFAYWAISEDEFGSHASQESTLSATEIAVTALTGTFRSDCATCDYIESFSIFEMSFTTNVATPFRMTGDRTPATAFVQLLEDGAVVAEGVASNFDVTGALVPGPTYTLLAHTQISSIAGEPTDSVAHVLFTVPEPGTALLLGSGILGLARRRHR